MRTDPTLALWYTLDKVKNAVVQTDPFPHVEIEDIFPVPYYGELICNIPLLRQFHPENESVMRLDLVPDPVMQQDQYKWLIDNRLRGSGMLSFWDNFREVYFSKVLEQHVLELFNIKPREKTYMTGRLCIDMQGSGLGPHTDRLDKVVSLIYHIPYDMNPQQPTCETLLFKPKDPNISVTAEHYSFGQFDEVKRIKYKPNKLFAFQVMRNQGGVSSFHGYNQTSRYNRQTIKTFIQRELPVSVVRAETSATKSKARRWRKEQGYGA